MLLSPTEKDPIKVADWVEVNALYSSTGQLSLEVAWSDIDTDGTLLEEPIALDEPEALASELSESLVASAAAEIKRRIQIAAGSYPFELLGGVVKASVDIRYLPYIFCLLVADREFYSPGEQHSTRLFEHLVCKALNAYLGGEAARFGAPRDTMPQGIIEAVGELANITGNRKLSNGYPLNTMDQDLGLDVAAWKDFPDQRWGKVELYVQCTTAQEWESKKGDCKLDEWRGILFWPFEPILGLAVPYVVSDYDWKRESPGVLLMDRIRIASILRDQDLSNDPLRWWEWCQERIEEGRH